MLKLILKIILSIIAILILVFVSMLIKKAIDSHKDAPKLGVQQEQLLPCPASPNCVCSDMPSDDSHYIDALSGQHWDLLPSLLNDFSRVEIIEQTDTYIYATFTSLLFRFVDDVEFHYRPEDDQIAVRSASRQGYSDLSANRNRIESIRQQLTEN